MLYQEKRPRIFQKPLRWPRSEFTLFSKHTIFIDHCGSSSLMTLRFQQVSSNVILFLERKVALLCRLWRNTFPNYILAIYEYPPFTLDMLKHSITRKPPTSLQLTNPSSMMYLASTTFVDPLNNVSAKKYDVDAWLGYRVDGKGKMQLSLDFKPTYAVSLISQRIKNTWGLQYLWVGMPYPRFIFCSISLVIWRKVSKL